MYVDLRKTRDDNSWCLVDGPKGYEISRGQGSACVRVHALDIRFLVSKEDLPSAWQKTIDADVLHDELLDAIERWMSRDVLIALLQASKDAKSAAFWAGESAVRRKLREAIGL